MKDFFYKNYKTCFLALVLLNFTLRIFIFYSTDLFFIGDFKTHLIAVEKISNADTVPLASGNFLFAISYFGYFFKYILGNSDYFFLFNCLLGTAASVIISFLVYAVTFNRKASILTLLILTFYTEFMVFSSVFYTVIIMIFLLSLLIFLLLKYYDSGKSNLILLVLIILVSTGTFLFKQELLFLPLFFIGAAFVLRKNRSFLKKTLILSVALILGTFAFYKSGILTKEGRGVLANDFVFFGHTDYGGDGGEGAFIYPENKERYYEAWNDYQKINGLKNTDVRDRNRFQLIEIMKFITHHPARWVKLQFTKFFRTFGVVPESISFKILYTGLFKDKLWLTSVTIVAPIAIIILLLIFFFDFQALKRIHPNGADTKNPEPRTQNLINNRNGFLYIYLTIFIYYLTATIFFGHYQERYRMPLMTLFIIPAISYFIIFFNKKPFYNRSSLFIKGTVIIIFLVIWILQANNALSNKERLKIAIESINMKTQIN